MKTIHAELFFTEFTETGIVPEFANVGHFKPDTVYKGDIIPYREYSTFLNHELQKLRKEKTIIENKTMLNTDHKGSYITISLTVGDLTYRVSKMKKAVWLTWFSNEFHKMTTLISSKK